MAKPGYSYHFRFHTSDYKIDGSETRSSVSEQSLNREHRLQGSNIADQKKISLDVSSSNQNLTERTAREQGIPMPDDIRRSG